MKVKHISPAAVLALLAISIIVSPVGACHVIIGDFVWEDLDCDGIQDYGEPGIPGVIVELYDCTGVPIASTTTDSEGKYYFTLYSDYPTTRNLCIKFVAPVGYYFTSPNQGADDDVDSDADPSTGKTGCFEVYLPSEGGANYTLDAGLCQEPAEPGESPGYWKHQVKAFVDGRGHLHETNIEALSVLINAAANPWGLPLMPDTDSNSVFDIYDAYNIFTNPMYNELWLDLANWYNMLTGRSPYPS